VAKNLQPLACPKCGNTTEQQGITYCYLEWRIMPVAGVDEKDRVRINYDENEGADLDSKAQVENVPAVTNDCEHFFCNKCHWNWHDPREQEDAND